MREYIGERVDGEAEVMVRDLPGKGRAILPGALAELKPRNDVANHSPDGFEWGYGGSGPAQLALAILCDHFEHVEADREIARKLAELWRRDLNDFAEGKSEAVRMALLCYQDFKFARIASIRDSAFAIKSDDVTETLRSILARVEAKATA